MQGLAIVHYSEPAQSI